MFFGLIIAHRDLGSLWKQWCNIQETSWCCCKWLILSEESTVAFFWHTLPKQPYMLPGNLTRRSILLISWRCYVYLNWFFLYKHVSLLIFIKWKCLLAFGGVFCERLWAIQFILSVLMMCILWSVSIVIITQYKEMSIYLIKQTLFSCLRGPWTALAWL